MNGWKLPCCLKAFAIDDTVNRLIAAAVHFGGQTRDQHLTGCCVLKEDTCDVVFTCQSRTGDILAESITTLQARHRARNPTQKLRISSSKLIFSGNDFINAALSAA